MSKTAKRLHLLYSLLTMLLAVFAGFKPVYASDHADADDVKAVYIFNFANFVTWPKNTISQPDQPFLICALGSNTLSDLLPQVVNGERIGDRSMEFIDLTEHDDVTRCQILLIAGQDKTTLHHRLETLRNLPVLTVSDDAGFAASGGHIELTLTNNRIGLIINRRSVDRSGLRISAKLYRLAKVIDQEG